VGVDAAAEQQPQRCDQREGGRDPATAEPAIEASQATAPARSEKRAARLMYTSGTMKKTSPSASPHQKPA